MIRAMLFDYQTQQLQQGGLALVSRWQGNQNCWIWVDIGPQEELGENRILCKTFGLNTLAIEDAMTDSHPPKLEVFDTYYLMLVRSLGASATQSNWNTILAANFVGERFILTRHSEKSVVIDTIWEQVERGKVPMEQGPSHLQYLLCKKMLQRFAVLIDGLSTRAQELQEAMFSNFTNELLENLMEYSQNLKRLRGVFNYHRLIFEALSSRSHPFVSDSLYHEFIDAYELCQRLADQVTMNDDLVDGLLNGYISITNHRLNQIIKVLTILTATFLPLTLLTGIYGMNFEHMPELDNRYGYFVLLGVMGLITAVQLLIFRRLNWIGKG